MEWFRNGLKTSQSMNMTEIDALLDRLPNTTAGNIHKRFILNNIDNESINVKTCVHGYLAFFPSNASEFFVSTFNQKEMEMQFSLALKNNEFENELIRLQNILSSCNELIFACERGIGYLERAVKEGVTFSAEKLTDAIEICTSLGDADSAAKLVQMMIDAGFTVSPPCHSSILDCYALKKVAINAQTYFEKVQATMEPNLSLHIAFMNALASSDHVPAALDVIMRLLPENGFKCDTKAFNSLMETLVRTGRCDEAKEVFEIMCDSPETEPDSTTKSYLFLAHVLTNDYNSALGMMENMESLDYMQKSFFGRLCVANGNFELPLALLKEMESKGIVNNAFLLAFINSGPEQLQTSFELVNDLVSKGYLSHKMIQSCTRAMLLFAGSLDTAFKIIQGSHETGSSSLIALYEAELDNNSIDFNQWDLSHFEIMFKSAGDLGHYEIAFDLLETMEKGHIQPTLKIYNILMESFAKIPDLDSQYRWKMTMKPFLSPEQIGPIEISPKVAAMERQKVIHAIKRISSKNDGYDAFEWFQKNSENPYIRADDINQLLTIIPKTRFGINFKRKLLEMTNEELWNANTYMIAYEAFIPQKHLAVICPIKIQNQSMENYFAKSCENKESEFVLLQLSTFVESIPEIISHNKKGVKYYQKAVEKGMSYTSMDFQNIMMNCSSIGDAESAIELFEFFQRRRIDVTVYFYEKMISLFALKRDLFGAQDWFERSQLHFKGHISISLLYMGALIACDNLPAALELKSRIVGTLGPGMNTGVFNTIINMLIKSGKVQDAIEIYGTMITRNSTNPPNSKTYSLMILAFSLRGDFINAKKINDLHPEAIHLLLEYELGFFGRAAIRNNDFETAFKILKDLISIQREDNGLLLAYINDVNDSKASLEFIKAIAIRKKNRMDAIHLMQAGCVSLVEKANSLEMFFECHNLPKSGQVLQPHKVISLYKTAHIKEEEFMKSMNENQFGILFQNAVASNDDEQLFIILDHMLKLKISPTSAIHKLVVNYFIKTQDQFLEAKWKIAMKTFIPANEVGKINIDENVSIKFLNDAIRAKDAKTAMDIYMNLKINSKYLADLEILKNVLDLTHLGTFTSVSSMCLAGLKNMNANVDTLAMAYTIIFEKVSTFGVPDLEAKVLKEMVHKTQRIPRDDPALIWKTIEATSEQGRISTGIIVTLLKSTIVRYAPPAGFLETIFASLFKKKMDDALLDFFKWFKEEKSLSASGVIQRIMIQVLCRQKKLTESLELLDEYLDQTENPVIAPFNSIMALHLSLDDTKGAVRVWQVLTQLGVEPNNNTHLLAIEALSKSDLFEEVVEIFKIMNTGGVDLLTSQYATSIINWLPHSDTRLDSIKFMLKELKIRDIPLEEEMYSPIIAECSINGEMDLAESLVRELQDQECIINFNIRFSKFIYAL